jgi:hypothetical protein
VPSERQAHNQRSLQICGNAHLESSFPVISKGDYMKLKTRVAGVAGLCLSLLSLPGTAHHAFSAQFDAEKPIKMTGTVTKVQWRNPHAWFYIDIEDDSGNVTNWGMELASPNLLMRQGWTRSSMKIGAAVTVEGYHARDGSNTGNARSVTLNATGKTLSMRSSDTGRGR